VKTRRSKNSSPFLRKPILKRLNRRRTLRLKRRRTLRLREKKQRLRDLQLANRKLRPIKVNGRRIPMILALVSSETASSIDLSQILSSATQESSLRSMSLMRHSQVKKFSSEVVYTVHVLPEKSSSSS